MATALNVLLMIFAAFCLFESMSKRNNFNMRVSCLMAGVALFGFALISIKVF